MTCEDHLVSDKRLGNTGHGCRYKSTRTARDRRKTRHGDVVVFNSVADGCRPVAYAMEISGYRNSVLSKVVRIPGYVAKQAEDHKLHSDVSSL